MLYAVVPRGKGYAYRFEKNQLNCHGPGVKAIPVARLLVQPGNSDLCFVWPGPIQAAIAHLQKQLNSGHQRQGAQEQGNQGAQGQGTRVYFRDPDGSLLEFISYADPSR